MGKAVINLRVLKALARVASTEATRYYLNGVYVEIASREVVYAATNGHSALAYHGAKKASAESNTLAASFIIPLDICRGFKVTKRAGKYGTLTWERLGLSLSLEYDGRTVNFEAIDGTFPDWRRIVPLDNSCSPADRLDDSETLNPEHVAAVRAAGADLEFTDFSVTMRGREPALILWSDPRLVGVVATMRQKDRRRESRPAWVSSTIGMINRDMVASIQAA